MVTHACVPYRSSLYGESSEDMLSLRSSVLSCRHYRSCSQVSKVSVVKAQRRGVRNLFALAANTTHAGTELAFKTSLDSSKPTESRCYCTKNPCCGIVLNGNIVINKNNTRHNEMLTFKNISNVPRTPKERASCDVNSTISRPGFITFPLGKSYEHMQWKIYGILTITQRVTRKTQPHPR
jgi:hypothetical protein